MMNKYATAGFNREAVAIAVANYGDNPIKVYIFFMLLLHFCLDVAL